MLSFGWLNVTLSSPVCMPRSDLGRVWGIRFMKQGCEFDSPLQTAHLWFLKGVLGMKRSRMQWELCVDQFTCCNSSEKKQALQKNLERTNVRKKSRLHIHLPLAETQDPLAHIRKRVYTQHVQIDNHMQISRHPWHSARIC